MLSDLQQRVALIFSKLPEAEQFVLAGGAALLHTKRLAGYAKLGFDVRAARRASRS